jgi:hypothetical protein
MANVLSLTPPTAFPQVVEEQGQGVTVGAAALASGIVGAAVGGGAVLASRLGKKPPPDDKGLEPTHYDDEPNNPS